MSSLLRARIHELMAELAQTHAESESLAISDGHIQLSISITTLTPCDCEGCKESDNLTPMQKDILKAARALPGTLPVFAKQLAELSGYPLTSYFRENLQKLVKNKLLTRSARGYHI